MIERSGMPAKKGRKHFLGAKSSIAKRLYYSRSKEVLEAGKRRLSGDAARAATRRAKRFILSASSMEK
jgi:hypothetical protein